MDNIKVFCRVRGLNGSEKDTEVVTEVDPSGSQITVNADAVGQINRRTYDPLFRCRFASFSNGFHFLERCVLLLRNKTSQTVLRSNIGARAAAPGTPAGGPTGPARFNFDHVFDGRCSQYDVFQRVGMPFLKADFRCRERPQRLAHSLIRTEHLYAQT
jgi:hypothetical protein